MYSCVFVTHVLLLHVCLSQLTAGRFSGCAFWKRYSREVAYSEIQAIEGREARLGCNNSLVLRGWEEEEAIQILWFRTGSPDPVFVVDGSNSSSLLSAPTVTAPMFQGRVLFDPGPAPTLRIRKVLRTDEGEYRCRTVYRRSRTQKCLILMTVISEYRSALFSLSPTLPLSLLSPDTSYLIPGSTT